MAKEIVIREPPDAGRKRAPGFFFDSRGTSTKATIGKSTLGGGITVRKGFPGEVALDFHRETVRIYLLKGLGPSRSFQGKPRGNP